MIIISAAFIFAGLIFLTAAAAGAIRLPDFYTRSHAIGVTDTAGSLLLISGLVFYFGLTLVSAKLIFAILFLFMANPAVTHVLFRAAVRAGLKPSSGKLPS
ncbi:MAG: hypothetical protein A2Z83_00760 [Omnitrophica bacterium GWA2_52_8]|nr:MAG: hypothetical protein A2Z83_00760 [Omnitrophica bacterium GWA2_52_8]